MVAVLLSAFGWEQRVTPDLAIGMEDVDAQLGFYIGLIANELLTNSIKYALPHSAEPKLSIALSLQHGALHLTVSDNGPGLAEPIESGESTGMGMRLIQLFGDELHGTQTFTNTQQGLTYTITIPYDERNQNSNR